MKKGFLYKIRRKMQVTYIKLTSPERVSKTYFKIMLHKKLDLENPQSFNEKIQWLKLYYLPKNELSIKCSDKYRVREYVKECGLENRLVDLISVYNNANEIKWDDLPDKFILKCNHGCRYNVLVTNKEQVNYKKETKKLNKWLKEKFGNFNGEIHYNEIDPKIVCEKYLGDNLSEYKLYCLNGKYRFMYCVLNPNKENEMETFFDQDGNVMDVKNALTPVYKEAKTPDCFKQLVEMSEKLAKPFPMVRVDWYIKDGNIYFGELTFTPFGGLLEFEPKEYDDKFGAMLDISKLVAQKNAK